MMQKVSIVAALILMLAFQNTCLSAIPQTIAFDGRLTDLSGNPLNGSYNLRFSIYNDSSGTSLSWGPESHSAVPLVGGVFSVKLGDTVTMSSAVFDSPTKYVKIEVANPPTSTSYETILPLTRIVATPFTFHALTADQADGVADNSITRGKIATGQVVKGITAGSNISISASEGSGTGIVTISSSGGGGGSSSWVDGTGKVTTVAKVGIGISSPSVSLEVLGTVKAASFEGSGSALTGLVRKAASSTDSGIPQWDGTTGGLLKNGLTAGTGANDLVQLDGSGRLPSVDGSQLQNLPSGFADPMTTRGDIIVRDSSNTTARLALGPASTVLKSVSSDVSWESLTPGEVGLNNLTNLGGNLGVGTSTPARKLSVHDASSDNTYGSGILLQRTDASTSGKKLSIAVASSNTNIEASLGVRNTGSNGNGDVFISTRNAGGVGNFGEALTVRADGNVGIGDSNPANKLVINGNTSTTGNITTTGTVSSGAVVSTGTLYAIGSVGIGTTSPGAKLHVKGSDMQLDASGDKWFYFKNGSGGAGDTNAEGAFGWRGAAGALTFWTPSGGNVIAATNTGRVGIGTTSPGASLEVVGDIKIGSAGASIEASTGKIFGDGSALTNLPSGFANPMTTRGDIIVRDSSNTTSRLALGPAGSVLKSVSSDVSWEALSASDVGLGNVPNVDATNATNISSGTLDDGRLSTNVATKTYVDTAVGTFDTAAARNAALGTFETTSSLLGRNFITDAPLATFETTSSLISRGYITAETLSTFETTSSLLSRDYVSNTVLSTWQGSANIATLSPAINIGTTGTGTFGAVHVVNRLGVGTTNPQYALDVSGEANFLNGGLQLRLTNVVGNWPSLYSSNDKISLPSTVYLPDSNGEVSTSGSGMLVRGWESLKLQNGAGTGYVSFGNTGAEYARFTNAGSLGIGTNEPQAFVDIRGDVQVGTAGASIEASTGRYYGDGSQLQNLPSGFADPMTTRGDIMVRNSGNVTSRFGLGAEGQVLRSRSSDVSWEALSKSDVGLGNVPNVDTTNANNISSGTLDDGRLSSNVATKTYVDTAVGTFDTQAARDAALSTFETTANAAAIYTPLTSMSTFDTITARDAALGTFETTSHAVATYTSLSSMSTFETSANAAAIYVPLTSMSTFDTQAARDAALGTFETQAALNSALGTFETSANAAATYVPLSSMGTFDTTAARDAALGTFETTTSLLSRGYVTNTELSTWAGTSNITTVGTLSALDVSGNVRISTTASIDAATGRYYGDGSQLQNLPSGFADPMTTRGDIMVRNSGNVTSRLALGGEGQVLRSRSSDVSWEVMNSSDVGLGNVPNVDATNATNISSGTLDDGRLSSNIATKTYVDTAVGTFDTTAARDAALGTFETTLDLLGRNFITDAPLATFETTTSLISRGYITAETLSTFETTSSLLSRDYVASSALSTFETTMSLTSRGYITAETLSTFETTSSLLSRDYVASSALGTFDTITARDTALGTFDTVSARNSALGTFETTTSLQSRDYVSNTVLSTWAGSANITTLGSISAGAIPSSIVTGLSASATIDATDAGNIVSGMLPVSRGGTGSSNGSITGSDALVFQAGGSNKGISIVPSGNGITTISSKLSIGTTIESDSFVQISGMGTQQLALYPKSGPENAALRLVPKGYSDSSTGSGSHIQIFNGDYYANISNDSRLEMGFAYDNAFVKTSDKSMTISANNNDTQLFLATNGAVGIGTTSPTSTLEVVGELKIQKVNKDYGHLFIGDERFLHSAGTDNAYLGHDSGSINNNGSFNIGLGSYSLAANVDGNNNTAIGAQSLGASTGSGNIGIGYYSGYYESGDNKLYIDNLDRTSDVLGREQSLIYGVFDVDPANQQLTFNAKVGIGTTTPSTALDVVGDIKIGSAGASIEASTGKYYGDGSYLSGIVSSSALGTFDTIAARDAALGTFETQAALSSWPGSTNLATLSPSININTTGTGSFSALTVTTGAVGVGTTSPSQPVEVRGVVGNYKGIQYTDPNTGNNTVIMGGDGYGGVGVFTGNNKTIYISASNANDGNSGYITINGASSATGKGTVSIAAGTYAPSSMYGDISMTAGSSSMVLKNSGNVGIGVPSPSVSLEVAGNVKIGSGGASIEASTGKLFGNGSALTSVTASSLSPSINISTTGYGTFASVSSTGTANISTSSGTVGVGTTETTEKVNISGNMMVRGQYYSKKYTTTTTLDWSNGNVQYIQLANNGQTFTFSNPKDGARYALILKQPSSGAAGTVTWPGEVLWSGGTGPTLTVTNDKVDVITLIYDGTNSKYYGGASLNY